MSLSSRYNILVYSFWSVLTQFRPVLHNQKLKEDFGFIPAKTSRPAFAMYCESKEATAA